MKNFWPNIIEPLLKAAHPNVIVEIGSDKGINTQNLLEYCSRHKALLYVIDPDPQYDVSAFQRRYGEHLIFLRDLSLDALPQIPEYDAVLIDGDHNWYTVFHELKVIESYTEEGGCFPLVLIHDTGWPYARRDLYYQPDRIPAQFRQEFRQSGVLPGRRELVAGGANSRHYHALLEGEPQCGVLTAVEDFLRQTTLALDFITLPSLSGLGMIADKQRLQADIAFAKVWESMTLSPPLRRHFEIANALQLERLFVEK